MSTTYERERNAHCAAVLEVLAAAGVPMLTEPQTPSGPDTYIALRPAMRALQFLEEPQSWIEAEIRDCETYQACQAPWGASGQWHLFVPLGLFAIFLIHGRHPVCQTYRHWQTGVHRALFRHGYYDPLTNHTPPALHQLDAIERREEGRAWLNAMLPGFGDAAAGQRPTTAEGRRLIGYRVTDEHGQPHVIRDCELPDELDAPEA